MHLNIWRHFVENHKFMEVWKIVIVENCATNL